MKKSILLFLAFLHLAGILYAQETRFPDWDRSFVALDGGLGTSDILVDGISLGLFFEPKLSLSPAFMIGTKNGLHFSTDNIIALETQAFFRWNFLRLDSKWTQSVSSGRLQNTTNLFIQGGAGFLGAFKGRDVRDSRSSLLFDATAGITIPLSSRWHIEPSIRTGYPFLFGIAVTVGRKFPLPHRRQVVEHETRVTEYVEVIRTLPPEEIIKRILIAQVEYIIFAPDISRFNVGIDHDARSLNELVLDQIALILRENPSYQVRIEGHANPITTDPREANDLMALSSRRADEVAAQLRARGVREGQMVVIAFGGTRTVTHDHDHWNMNRRVELIVVQIDLN